MKRLNKLVCVVLVGILLLGSENGYCCLNEYRTLLSGAVIISDEFVHPPMARFDLKDKINLLRLLNEAESIYKATGDLEDYSDFAAMLVYNGQYLKAKMIFLEIENKSPGLYHTAANLGTTFELLGKNDSAYYWIKKALEINDESHYGSEWIHLKILEAKIKTGGDENLLQEYNILGLDFGNNKIPENIAKLDLILLQNQLSSQLRERMTFIQPQDPVVAQLLFQLGNIAAITTDVKSALQIYAVAHEYGYSSELLDRRVNHFETLQLKADFMGSGKNWIKRNLLFSFAIALLTSVLLLYSLRIIVKRIKKA